MGISRDQVPDARPTAQRSAQQRVPAAQRGAGKMNAQLRRELDALRTVAAEKRAAAVEGVDETTSVLLKRTTALINRSKSVEAAHEASKRKVVAATSEIRDRLMERQRAMEATKSRVGVASAKMASAIEKQSARREAQIKRAASLWSAAAPGAISLGTARAT